MQRVVWWGFAPVLFVPQNIHWFCNYYGFQVKMSHVTCHSKIYLSCLFLNLFVIQAYLEMSSEMVRKKTLFILIFQTWNYT